jgi:hypothetical protein
LTVDLGSYVVLVAHRLAHTVQGISEASTGRVGDSPANSNSSEAAPTTDA